MIVTTTISTIIGMAFSKWSVAGVSQPQTSVKLGKENLMDPDLGSELSDGLSGAMPPMDERLSAFAMLCTCLDRIKELDKKKWQHKVYYRVCAYYEF